MVIAACMVARVCNGSAGYSGLSGQAWAQPVRAAGAHGIFAFSGQLTKDSYGVFMVDVDTGTLWCYRFLAGQNELKLVAARDWRHDRYLEEFATDPPIDVIQHLLEQQRAAALQAASPQAPDVNGSRQP